MILTIFASRRGLEIDFGGGAGMSSLKPRLAFLFCGKRKSGKDYVVEKLHQM